MRDTPPSARGHRMLLMPPLFWLLVFFAVPLGIILLYSVSLRDIYGGVTAGFTLEHFARAFDPIYTGILLRSLGWAGLTTLLCLAVGYPMAYYTAFAGPRVRAAVLLLVIVPFWTSFLIRMYSFSVILGGSGIVNTILMTLGLVAAPLSIMHTPGAVILGFTYINLPFMFLPIYSSIDRIDPSLLEASMDLGAGRLRTFLRVSLPWSLSGVATGAVFVFVPSLGNFVVPDILGGPDTLMIGNVVTSQFLNARNWPGGSALSAVLLFIVMIFVALYIRYGNRDTGAGA